MAAPLTTALPAAAGLEALWRLALAGGLGAARALPITWVVPAFGGARLALQARVGIGLTLAALVAPRLVPGLDGLGLERAGPLLWLLLVGRELLIGVTVGLVAATAFRAAEAAGGLVDRLRADGGAAPPSSGETSPLGELYLFLAIVIFLELGGLGRLAAAFARSYDAIPLGAGQPAGWSKGLQGAAALVTLASARLIESAVGLAAPVIVALLLADVVLGALARLSPGAPIQAAAAPAKALLGVAVVLLGVGGLEAALAKGLPGWMALAERGFAIWGR